MKFSVISLLLSCNLFFSQTLYESIESEALGVTRELKIQLPRNYEANEDQAYPLIIVFDGDYLFETVAGNVDYYSYWEDMPDAIVVGVNQIDSREDDCTISVENFLPYKKGAQFYDFVVTELIPFVTESYRSLDFKIAVGHGKTANFINYFLFKKSPVFNAFIALSPELAPYMQDNLTKQFSVEQKKKSFYYLSTASEDIKQNKKEVVELNAQLSVLENSSLSYMFDNFEGATHYSLVTHSIPNALEGIFSGFQPITRSEYINKILALETSPVDYLIEKYEAIKEVFGVEKQMLVNDFKAIAAAIEKTKQYELYKDLGNIARKQHPETVLAPFYLARYYEESGKPKKAMNAYRSSYTLGSIQGYSKEDMLDRADEIQKEFGY
jgi:predicted alpha/beta superfamily hydrolase|tara:strand:- start:1044 stop:2189 length:1146 start_codon:yes stop_codon:yes gene_type:complete